MIDTILRMVNKFIPDTDEANKLALSLEQEMTKQMEMKSNIIQSENANGSGKWRPRLMYMCMTMVGAHFVMYDIIPYFIIICDIDVVIPMAPENAHLWSFLKIGVGGYLGGRSAEKITAWIKEK